jgi:hypothetical protein
MTDLEALTAADFTAWRDGRFRIEAEPARRFEVELIEVSEGAGGGLSRSPFSLVFRGGPSPPLPQRIYRVEHEALGALDIFLVPIGPDEVGQRYEAVFT